jgi:homoserine kinase
MHDAPLRHARVRVPCSTSNLGSGFDCIGLALDRHVEASFEPGGERLTLERSGFAALTSSPEQDLLLRAFRAGLDELEITPHGLLRVTSDIPIGRGLGSSAAAIVAGLTLAGVAADGHAQRQIGRNFERGDVVARAASMEGHPDNVGAAVLGGLVAAAPVESGDVRRFTLTRLPLSPRVGFAFAAPTLEVPTTVARAALPETVPHAVAVRSVSRVIALLRGLAEADGSAIRVGFDDELHVPYRLPLIPRARDAFEAARAAGAWAATISGSGSGLIAACPHGLESAVCTAMSDALGADAIAFPVHVDEHGTRVLEQGD